KNHDVSCGCGCQQDTYNYEQKQEEYIANEQMTSHYNQEAMYPTTNESMQEDTTYENKQYNESYTCSPVQFTTPNLPVESTRFQSISAIINSTNPRRVLSAMDTNVGQWLGRIGFNTWACETVDYTNTVLNEFLSPHGIAPIETQEFIFYQLDNSNFIIANRGNGRVLEVRPSHINDWITISSLYSSNNPNQNFRIIRETSNRFRLTTEALPNRQIDICGHFGNSYTKIAANTNSNQDNAVFEFVNTHPINLPPLAPPTQLGPLPALRYLQDSGLAPHE
ncbi:hypothetical protein, partial [Bacillus thuringiensis]|uniref:hypothetical protein n=1 Tax=Bacillus thuringiensis TaxID=1428 RepID=UPI002E178693|nr:hypothetical protein [Bacillus thuringiensis]